MTNNKQQTAVEWLEMEVKKFNTVITKEYILLLCQQAKEMDKEQKINDFKHAQVLHAIGDETRAEQYYEQTYGVDNK
jgi:hypothetical protein